MPYFDKHDRDECLFMRCLERLQMEMKGKKVVSSNAATILNLADVYIDADK